MSIKLVSFHLCPFVQRAVIALQEKGVSHEIDYIDLADPPAWFAQCSPLGKVPLLLIGDDVLFESSVILDYLDEIYQPRLHPSDPLLRAQHKAWIAFGSDLLMQQHALAVAEDETAFHGKLDLLHENLRRLDLPLGQGLFGESAGPSLVDVAYAPLFLRLSILMKYRPEVASAYSAQVKGWAESLLARSSSQASVLPDFEARFEKFFREKGSWAVASSAVSN